MRLNLTAVVMALSVFAVPCAWADTVITMKSHAEGAAMLGDTAQGQCRVCGLHGGHLGPLQTAL